MDPDAAHRNMLDLAWRIDMADGRDAAPLGSELVDSVFGLDEWITKGGALPQPWADAQQRHASADRDAADVRRVDETGGVL